MLLEQRVPEIEVCDRRVPLGEPAASSSPSQWCPNVHAGQKRQVLLAGAPSTVSVSGSFGQCGVEQSEVVCGKPKAAGLLAVA